VSVEDLKVAAVKDEEGAGGRVRGNITLDVARNKMEPLDHELNALSLFPPSN
jgi:hypothetical protein